MSLLLDAIKKAEQRQGNVGSDGSCADTNLDTEAAVEIEFESMEIELSLDEPEPLLDPQHASADLSIPFESELLPELLEEPELSTLHSATATPLNIGQTAKPDDTNNAPIELAITQPADEPTPDTAAAVTPPLTIEKTELGPDIATSPAADPPQESVPPAASHSTHPTKQRLSIVNLLLLLIIALGGIFLFYFLSDQTPTQIATGLYPVELTDKPNPTDFHTAALNQEASQASAITPITQSNGKAGNQPLAADGLPTEKPASPLIKQPITQTTTPPKASLFNKPTLITSLNSSNSPTDSLAEIPNDQTTFSITPVANTPANASPLSQPRILLRRQQQQGIEELKLTADRALNSGDLKTATTYYQKWLTKRPAAINALFGLAAIATLNKDRSLAVGYYQSILQTDPNNSTAQASLLRLPGQASDKDLRQLSTLLKASPSDSFLNYLMGNYQAQRGDWKQAQHYYFNGYALQPENASYAYNLAIALDQLGQAKPAINYYQQALAQTIMPLNKNTQLLVNNRLDTLRVTNP